MTDESGVIACFLLHCDDCLIAAEKDLADRIARQLMDTYELTNSGTPSWVLGFAVDYDLGRGTLRIHQQTYVHQLLDKFAMSNCNPCKTPAAAVRLTLASPPMSEEEAEEMRHKPSKSRGRSSVSHEKHQTGSRLLCYPSSKVRR